MTLLDVVQEEKTSLEMISLVEAKAMSIVNTRQAQRYKLTPREMQILGLYAEGYSSEEIATRLSIGYQIIKNHSSNFRPKLEAKDIAHAVYKATMEDILTEETEKQELTLTPAQTINLFYTARGYTHRETASKLSIVEQTVKDHLHNARERNNNITTERLVYLATIQYFKRCPVTLTEEGVMLVERPMV